MRRREANPFNKTGQGDFSPGCLSHLLLPTLIYYADMAMQLLTFPVTDEIPIKMSAPLAEQLPAVARKTLSELTHQLQLFIRKKPKNLFWLLEFYQAFLQVKEDLEHYFTREHALLKSLQETGANQRRAGIAADRPPTPSTLPEKIFRRLQEELSCFVALLSRFPIPHRRLKGHSLALHLF
jgi:hypothetical protein